MKFLIFGCNGMAGHMISLYLKRSGHLVTGFARQPSDLTPVVTGDASNLTPVRKIMETEEGKRTLRRYRQLRRNPEPVRG